MSRVAVLLLLSAAALVVANDDPTVSLDGVLDLDGDNFDKFVNGKKHALVEFYAPWCGHCKRLTPVYKELGEQVNSDGKLASRVVIAKVDADKHRGLGERFGIQGFPTIKYFGRGKSVESPEDYNGGRTLDAFTSFLEEKIKADAGFARVEALDPLAKSFADAEDKADIVAQATAAAATLQGDDKLSGDLYVRFMTKAAEKGVAYLHKELARLEKMLGGGSMSSSKVDEISRKISVLSAFVQAEEE